MKTAARLAPAIMTHSIWGTPILVATSWGPGNGSVGQRMHRRRSAA